MTSDLGSTRIRRNVETVPVGLDYVQRARRRDPLDCLKLGEAQRAAAIRWRLAAQHVAAGGARPPKSVHHTPLSEGGHLWAQERTLRDAEIYRIGRQALGPVMWLAWLVLVEERPCHTIDRMAGRRIGTTARMVASGLHRMARAYRLETTG